MGLLADIYSAGDGLKRKVGGLLSDPMGTIDMADLRDFLQSMSNSAASNVSAPVDGINWLMRKSGLPVSDAPFMGSDWMAQKGFTRPVKQGAASVLGETAGMLAPMAVAAKAPQIARGLLQAEANAMAPRTLNPQTGAIVWHGSPHKFDKFDSSKIGTGEGAQAYGHGLYLAENRNIAQGYADVVGRQHGQKWLYGDEKVSKPGDAGSRWALAGIDWLKKTGGDKEAAISAIKRNWEEVGYSVKGKDFRELKKWINEADFSKVAPDNNLYKVDLPDEHIAKMLDWDKPLSQQAPEVNKALKNFADLQGFENYIPKGETAPVLVGRGISGDSRGQDLYKFFGRDASSDDAASTLRGLGIPGIRYLDGGSRGAGQGSSNFVVFPGNEGLLQILERNGQPIGGR